METVRTKQKTRQSLKVADAVVLSNFVAEHKEQIDGRMTIDDVFSLVRRHEDTIPFTIGDRSMKAILKNNGIKTLRRKYRTKTRTGKKDPAQTELLLAAADSAELAKIVTEIGKPILEALRQVNKNLVSLQEQDGRKYDSVAAKLRDIVATIQSTHDERMDAFDAFKRNKQPQSVVGLGAQKHSAV